MPPKKAEASKPSKKNELKKKEKVIEVKAKTQLQSKPFNVITG